MDEFPANSARLRREEALEQGEKKIERVTTGEVDVRRRGLGRKMKETFIGGSARLAIDFMVTDVVVPAIQDTLIDALQGGIEKLFKGESRTRRNAPTSYSGLGQVNYAGMSTNKPPATRSISRQARTRHDFGDIVIHHRPEAEEVLGQMFEMLSRFGMVSVADLYEMTGIESSHTDHKWGWRQLPGARVQRHGRDGFSLGLPDPEPLSG